MGKHATGHEKAGLRSGIMIRRNPPLVAEDMKEIQIDPPASGAFA
jgi:hypothetical protein